MRSIGEPAFAPPGVLPFAPGASPFRQKGNAYLVDMEYYETAVRGGTRAVVAAIGDPKVRAFFEQTFRPSEWYDTLPGGIIELTASRLRGVSFEEHRRRVGAWHAARAVRGIYSMLFKVVSHESIALWTSRFSSLYFEFGKVETSAAGPNTVQGWWRGLPCEMAQCVCYGTVGFCAEVLRRTGARDPVVTLHEVEGDGLRYACELVRVRLRMTWK